MNSNSTLKVFFVFVTVIILIVLFAVFISGNVSDEKAESSMSNSDMTLQIISLIQDEKNDNAIKVFEQFSEQEALEKLPIIVTTVYAGNVNNTYAIISFIKKLGTCSDNAVAYQSLLSAMEENGHVTDPEVILLVGWPKVCNKHFNEMKKNVSGHVTAVVNEWTVQIQSGSFDDITEFYKKYWQINSNELGSILQVLIRRLFTESSENVDAILNFLGNLPHPSAATVGYSTLYAEMTKKGDGKRFYPEMFKLAFGVKDAMSMATNISENKSVQRLTDLKNQLPFVFQKIVWGAVCTLKNVPYGEYMYSPACAYNFYNYLDEKFVFTWIPNDGWFKEARWIFKASADKGRHFQIINESWQKAEERNVYLARNTDGDDNQQPGESLGQVVTTNLGIPNRQINWRVEPVIVDNVNSVKGVFYLREAGEGGYLFAGNNSLLHDEHRRSVFTLVGERSIPYGSQWEIDCT